MRCIAKLFLATVAVAILSLAGYGAFVLLTGDGNGEVRAGAAATEDAQIAPRTLSEAGDAKSVQDSHYDEMAKLCTQHMQEMQPLMEQMMRDMMAEMMGDDMMDGMMR